MVRFINAIKGHAYNEQNFYPKNWIFVTFAFTQTPDTSILTNLLQHQLYRESLQTHIFKAIQPNIINTLIRDHINTYADEWAEGELWRHTYHENLLQGINATMGFAFIYVTPIHLQPEGVINHFLEP